MADTKVTALSELGGAIADTDVFLAVDDPGGTPVSVKVLFSRLKTYLLTAPQVTTIELGHASDTTLARSSAGVATIEGSAVLMASNIGVTVAGLATADQVITGGARVTSLSLGTVSSGTTTPDPGDRPMQHYTNNGAHTLAPGSNAGSYLLDITNGAAAGAINTSGWTKVDGDAFTIIDTNKFRCHCSVGNAGSLLIVQALQ